LNLWFKIYFDILAVMALVIILSINFIATKFANQSLRARKVRQKSINLFSGRLIVFPLKW